MDDEARPLANVTIRLVLADKTVKATTSAQGKFTLSKIPPGTFNITAEVEGFQGATRTVVVKAGEVAKVSFSLVRIPTDEPYPESIPHNGYMSAGIAAVRRSVCCLDGLSNFWHFNGFPDDYAGIVFESKWDTSDSLEFVIISRPGGGDKIFYLTRAQSSLHVFAERCVKYDQPPSYGNTEFPCTLADIRASQRGPTDPANASRYAHVQVYYSGQFESTTQTLNPVCTMPAGTYPAQPNGCYGVGAVADLRWQMWMTFFHNGLPADAASFSVFGSQT
jgi:hypothetical protein